MIFFLETRAQNRASQQAYRSHQAKHVENLEHSMKGLAENYKISRRHIQISRSHTTC